MVSAERLVAFIKLQQAALDTEDSSNLLNNLLPQAVSSLSALGLPYPIIAAVFVDPNGQVQNSFCALNNTQPGQPISCSPFMNLASLFTKGSSWENELAWGKTFISSDVAQLIQPVYLQSTQIKSFILSPTHFGKKLTGSLIIATPRAQGEITQEELEIAELLSHLVSMAYKIQDTETSLTKITQEIYQMNAKLHGLDKLKDDFVSVASHELRTPMTAIKSYLWMALKKPDAPLSEKMNRYIERAYISTERLINLVNDMLNVSRIEAGRIEIRPSVFGMEQLVDEVVGEVSAKAAEKSIKLNVLKGNIPQVFADMDKVHQVLLNLIGNSLKFTPDAGTITISFFPDGKMLELSVKDSGVGMSQDDMSRLFQKFGRLDNSYVAAATSGGTGLGLFISKNLVELMGGKIWVNSEGTGKGSTFTFSLPIATPEIMAQAEKYTKKVAEGEAKVLEPVAI